MACSLAQFLPGKVTDRADSVQLSPLGNAQHLLTAPGFILNSNGGEMR